VYLLGEELQRWDAKEKGEAHELVGSVPKPVPEESEKLRCAFRRIDHLPGQHVRAHLVKGQLEGCNHPEVSTPPSDGPEQVRVVGLIGPNHLAGGGHHVRAEQIVGCQAMLSCQPAEAAPQGEAGHPHGGNRSGGGREAMGLGRLVHIPPRAARADRDPPSGDVHLHGLHRAQVDQQPALGHRVAGIVVPSAFDREGQVLLPGELNGGGYIAGIQTPSDEIRPAVKASVPDRPGLVVTLIAG